MFRPGRAIFLCPSSSLSTGAVFKPHIKVNSRDAPCVNCLCFSSRVRVQGGMLKFGSVIKNMVHSHSGVAVSSFRVVFLIVYMHSGTACSIASASVVPDPDCGQFSFTSVQNCAVLISKWLFQTGISVRFGFVFGQHKRKELYK